MTCLLRGRKRPNDTTIRLTTCVATALTIAILPTGCSTDTRHPDAGARPIVVAVNFVDANGNALSGNGRPDNGVAWLGAIPGAFFGKVHPPIQSIRIGARPDFVIDIDQIQAAYGRVATRMTVDAAAYGYKMIPEETRFTRIGTSFSYDGPRRAGLRIRFADSESKNTLELVFFDRPCRITGTIRKPGKDAIEQIVDVTIDKAGLTWLELEHSRNGADTYDVFRRAPEGLQPLFVVEPTPVATD